MLKLRFNNFFVFRYQPESNTNDEDDEHDDYGFNRRPSVRGIKPRFSSTNEILQQIQNQLQPPTSQPSQPSPQPPQQQPPPPPRIIGAPAPVAAWPYYPESNINNIDNKNSIRPTNQLKKEAGDYSTIEAKYAYAQSYQFTQGAQYRGPTYRPDESMYQNCTNQRCTQQHYATLNHMHTPVMRVGGGCAELYQTLPSRRGSGRPESPPPMEVARNYHQTMVLIPYNHIEGYHPGVLSPVPPYANDSPPNYRGPPKVKPMPGQHIIHQTQDIRYQCNTSTILKGQKQMIRVPYSSGQPLQVKADLSKQFPCSPIITKYLF